MGILIVIVAFFGIVACAQLIDAITPPFVTSPTKSSLVVNFQPFEGLRQNDVMAYDISMRSLMNQYWTPIATDLGSEGQNISDAQIVSIRVDKGVLKSGTFQLELEFGGLLGEDFEKLARSAPIPWDATSRQLKDALAAIKSITVKEVRRCDEFGSISEIGYGGSRPGWVHGCPNLANGGYRWLVVFDAPAKLRIPTLVPYRNHLGAGFSGPGPQIEITHIREGMVSPALCSPTLCSYNATGLYQGTPYAFKVRALSSETGWTDFSPVSAFVSTEQWIAPARPHPPLVSSVLTHSASLLIRHPPPTERVNRVECEYRAVDVNNDDGALKSAQWMPILPIDVSPTSFYGQVTIPLGNLEPSTTYEARVRYFNDVGASEFSGISERFQTAAIEADLSLPPPPVVAVRQDGSGQQAITASSIDVVVTANASLYGIDSRVSYKVEYKSEFDLNWQSLPESIEYAPRSKAVTRYEIATRISAVDKQTSCSGFFWLKFGVIGDVPTWSLTAPISSTATSAEMTAALSAVGQIAAIKPRITVRRYTNAQNGLSWVVEIEGAPNAGRLDLFKHTMISSHVQMISEPNTTLSKRTNSSKGVFDTVTSFGPCWVPNPLLPVVITLLSAPETISPTMTHVLRISGLLPQRGYYVRVASLDKNGFALGMSSVVYAQTKEDFQVANDLPISFRGLSSDGLHGQWSMLSVVSPKVREALDKVSILENSITVPGHFSSPARQSDVYYVAGVGTGGLSGQDGAPGHCTIISFNSRKLDGYRAIHFYYTGTLQTFTIPPMSNIDGTITFVTIKCWGGGGAGGKVSDLVPSPASAIESYSFGGGGAFAQVTVHVQPGETLNILVAGGGASPHGEAGGFGGFGGGGRGGNALARGGGGGGGGGASIVTRSNGDVLLVAAGGAGGGSTDYCCSVGGAAGTANGGYAGTSPGDATPWPISTSELPTPVRRRFEYTSSACPDDSGGEFCISLWDVLPQSLPSLHENLQYGETPVANYSFWATAGGGGSATAGGAPGTTGSIEVRTGGDAIVLMFGSAAVYDQKDGLRLQGMFGSKLLGGNGADGKEGGGGGGGGWFGGGGGGSGIDGGGGGGGSSFVNDTATKGQIEMLLAAIVPQPTLMYIDDESAIVSWTSEWRDSLWGQALSFDVELAIGPNSLDYVRIGSVNGKNLTNPLAQRMYYTVTSLQPGQKYRLRVTPIYSHGRGTASVPLPIVTLLHARDYWEPIITRRLSLVATGRGFSDPVLNTPHLDTGVEIYKSRTNILTALDFTDPATATIQTIPSGRRGQSFSAINNEVFMFGGRTNGYTCSSIYRDLLNIGVSNSGLDIDPCTHVQGEVNELWSFDIHTYEWTKIDTTVWKSTPPPAREQHVAAVIGTNIYIFGGKTRAFPKNPDGTPFLQYRSDHVFNDVWRLNIQPIVPFTLASDLGVPEPIPSDRRMYLPLNGTSVINNRNIENARIGQCVSNLVVKVVVEHQCINQLRLSLMGPGPETGSPNFHDHSASHEVSLINQPQTTQSTCVDGIQSLVFDDLALVPSNECCRNGATSGAYRPDGKLAEFFGSSPSALWTLVVEDMRSDALGGAIISWEIEFTLVSCQPSYTWTNISLGPGSKIMPPVYQARSVVYGTAFFVFDGRDARDNAFNQLYRFETTTNKWTQLTPVDFKIALDFSSAVGANFLITPWGLLRFGGYRRQYDKNSQYIADVFVQDPVTQRWSQIDAAGTPFQSLVRAQLPSPRYLSSSVYLAASRCTWRRPFDYRGMFDRPIPSTFANYANGLMDSVLMFGGFDASTGSLYDGSSGGLLNDAWILRLANESVPRMVSNTEAYRATHCEWRSASASTTTCLGANGAKCNLRDLIMLAWCNKNYQSV